jgi:CDP-glycerol glycerophosphotransferase (TagB/SpsB family)
LDSVVAFSAADVMLTDYSGVGFDGILLDLGMIYWDCPEFYGEYLPNRYGIDGEDARRDLACNAGLETGIEVRTVEELASAIAVYRECPEHNAEKRERVRVQLLFNPGAAAQAMAQKILEIMGVN